MALSLFALPGCGNRAVVLQPKIEDLKSKIENEAAAPAIAIGQELAKLAAADSAQDPPANADDSLAELVPVALLPAVPDAPEGGAAPEPAAQLQAPAEARNSAPAPIPLVQPQAPVSVRVSVDEPVALGQTQAPVSVRVSVDEPVALAELQAAPVSPLPSEGDGGSSALAPRPPPVVPLSSSPPLLAEAGGQRAAPPPAPAGPGNTAAEPAPVAQAQAPAISLELDTTELQPGARLFGQVRGSWGNDVARLLWLDGKGRVIGELQLKPPAEDSSTVPFVLAQPEGGVGQRHQLVVVRASKGALARSEKDGTPVVFDIAAQAAFRVLPPPSPRSWNDYVALLGDGCENVDPAFWRGLGRNGIQGGVVVSLEPGTELARQGALFLSNALPHEGNPLHLGGNWAARLRAYAGSREAKLLERQPPLFDDKVLAAVRADIGRSVALKSALPPLGWSLGDRLSLTQDAHPFDYDMSPRTLEVFREWLEDNYGSLSALNRQWGTAYNFWGEVTPPTTDAAKSANNPAYTECLKALRNPPAAPAPPAPKAGETPAAQPKAGEKPAPQAPALPEAKWEEREGLRGFSLAPEQLCAPGHENFSAWSDWRTFCDFAFGRLLREYRALVRESAHAPTAAAGLLGAELPAAWGGWDYSALAKSVDWIEERNSVLAREMFRSFAPSAHCLSSFSAGQDDDLRRLWDRWLRGDSGCILQQHQRWLAAPEYQPAPAAKAFLAELRCLTGGLTLLRSQALPESNVVALYYSPRSVQLHWMLDSEAQGSWWLNRDGVYEAAHGSALLQMESWWTLLEDLGHALRFVSPQQLLSGDLLARKVQGKAEAAGSAGVPPASGVKVLVLPKVLSLSDDEADALRRFARAGGVVIADGACGTFDGHGKRRQPLFVTATADAGAIGNLDRDFGIMRKDLRVLERDGVFLGDDSARLSFRNDTNPESSELRILEPGVVAGEARGHAVSRGGAAALLATNLPGRGRFVYLNLAMQDYPQLRARRSAGDFRFQGMSAEEYAKTYGQPTGGEALRLVIGDILSEVLPDSPPRVRTLDGKPVRAIKRVRFNLGKEAWLFGLLPTGPTGLATERSAGVPPASTERSAGVPPASTERSAGVPPASVAGETPAVQVWVGLEKKSYWYDVRAGLGLGLAAMVKTALDPNRPALLAALPYHAEKLKLKVRRADARGIFKVEASLVVDDGEPGMHVFHVEVSGPDGQLLPHYTRNVTAEKGRWAAEVALALNEPAGTYQLTVRDPLTGIAATGSLLKDIADYTSFSTPLKP